jgi:hypothetical protein
VTHLKLEGFDTRFGTERSSKNRPRIILPKNETGLPPIERFHQLGSGSCAEANKKKNGQKDRDREAQNLLRNRRKWTER